LRGILLILAAVFCFSSMDTLVKHVLKSYPIGPLIWARYTVHLLFMLVLLTPRMRLDLVRTRHPGVQVLRGLLLVLSTGSFFVCLEHMPPDTDSRIRA
jgi:drug/metabolite transporter (DMT)-like permease